MGCEKKSYAKGLLLVLIFTMISSPFFVFAGGNQESQDSEKTIVLAVESEPGHLDPHISTTWSTFRILFHIFEGFVTQDLTDSTVQKPAIVPALAEKWEIGPEYKEYTFYLREGVKFHDGTPWNAEAAKFNLDRMTNPEFEYYNDIAGGMMSWMWADLKSYDIIDEYTFKITLKETNSDFLQRLTQGGTGSATMVSPASVKKYGNQGVNSNPVGTGPFKFIERVHGEKIVLEKNDDYWNEDRIPKVDKWIIRGMAEVATRHMALETGEADIIGTPSPDYIETLESKGMKIITGNVPTLYMLWLNFKEPYFQDIRVRQAVAMAINRKAMSRDLKKGMASPAYGVLPYGSVGYEDGFIDYEYNPERARELLAEAGYPDGFKTRFDWTLGGGGDVDTGLDAEWMQRDLAAIGIDATIELFDNNTYWNMMADGMRKGTGFMCVSWGETSPFWMEEVFTTRAIPPGGFNTGYYNNPKIDELLLKARRTPDEEKQVEYLREFRDIIAKEAAFIPYYHGKEVYAMNPEITGFGNKLAPQHWQDFTQVDVK